MPRKVLIANRGEIAVRIIRACRDSTVASVAVYADSDRNALHTRLADEAYALNGNLPVTTYLDIDKLVATALRSGADAVHPGYGFLSENADFAAAVISAGLTWIGPAPEVIRQLGDKVAARHIAASVGAPLAPGTDGPVSDVREIYDFVAQHGLPIAIKASFGGGGRGLKVAYTGDEIDEQYESAVREATAAFGRGDCFVESYLDRPRHVETQCLADAHGNVVVVSTRDCTLQRRHQKLIEEAPAPSLSAEQIEALYVSSKAILLAVGYVGAGTCEFLVGRNGVVSFLEVNTRLQVEHPVSEVVTGIDLVQEQLRIADGEPLGYSDPPVRGHAFEFRINAEDPARAFAPAPGTLTGLALPSGPGVRLDSGVETGSVIEPVWDSMLAKLVVFGADRSAALRRASRALAECRIEGVPTTVALHREVVNHPDFAEEPIAVHTRWIETEMAGRLAPAAAPHAPDPDAPQPEREVLVVEVDGKRVEVSMPPMEPARTAPAPRRQRAGAARAAAAGEDLSVPMQGTVVSVAVREDDLVDEGDLVAVIEAMKMEQPVRAHRSGRIDGLSITSGDSVTAGETLCRVRSP